MARSKREPVYTEGYGSPDKKLRKRKAARKVRAADDVPSGKAYRKLENPWNITDYKMHAPRDKKAGRK